MVNNPDDVRLAQKSEGSQQYNGWCQAFVEHVTNAVNHFASAIDAWNKQEGVPGMEGIKPGDVVYFSANKSNDRYGHTGIYEGNNSFVSATDNGVKSFNLGDWSKITGQKLLGYVPQNWEVNNMADGQSIQQMAATSQENPLMSLLNTLGNQPKRKNIIDLPDIPQVGGNS